MKMKEGHLELRWCQVASSAEASYYIGVLYGKDLLSLHNIRNCWTVFVRLCHKNLSLSVIN